MQSYENISIRRFRNMIWSRVYITFPRRYKVALYDTSAPNVKSICTLWSKLEFSLFSASSYDFELCEFKSQYFHQKIISQIVERKIFANCLGQEKKTSKQTWIDDVSINIIFLMAWCL